MSTSDPAELQTKDALFASASLLTAIGTNSNGSAKLFPDEIPDETMLPAGCYARADSTPENLLGGAGPVRVSMSVIVWAKTRAQANSLATLVVAAMIAAGHMENGAGSTNTYEEQLDEYAAVRVFDVWEL